MFKLEQSVAALIAITTRGISNDEVKEVASYYNTSYAHAYEMIRFCLIFRKNNHRHIHQTCELISQAEQQVGWDKFKEMRANVIHTNEYGHKGIDRLSFAIVSQMLSQPRGNGSAVSRVEKW
ncbi:hypothetical protein [Vibrio sp. WXL210]|uniref:hypothetical protein n=1 Tax=Vibrio sp. WXL210 TaxID=3450709 RepID=UPI003EC816F8